MPDLSRDPVIQAIHKGIKHSIEVVINNKCYGAALILIYSALDTMASLAMPDKQKQVTRSDFIAWSNRFMKFPCKEQLSGEDLYGARCAILHSYGIESALSSSGRARKLGYMDKSIPEIIYRPEESKELVLVSIEGMKDALFNGIDRFLIYSFSDKERGKIVERRLEDLIQAIPREES